MHRDDPSKRSTSCQARVSLWALLVFLGLLPCAAPGRAEDPEAVSYSASGYVVLDPARATRPNDQRLLLALYDPLTAFDPETGQVVPAAALRWHEAADGRSWTFQLDPRGTWGDGSKVKASDFVAAWQRVVDPYEPQAAGSLFRPLAGCATIADGDRAMRALNAAGKGLEDLLSANPKGVPGREMGDLLLRTGALAIASAMDDPAVKRMVGWGDDPFPKAKAEAAIDALKQERRRWKGEVYDRFDLFGKSVGATAKDDHTLVVFVEGRTPWLPQLLARSAFAPLHPSTFSGGVNAFEPGRLVTNGPYRLHGRGPKARPGVPDPDSVVHVTRRDDYRGTRAGAAPEILCFTDQGAEEDLRRLTLGQLQWMASGTRDVRKALAKEKGYRELPEGRLLLLRFRVDRPPFDDVRLRRALALTVDRALLARRLWPTAVEAWRIVPEGSTGVEAGVRAPRGSAPDAQALLKEAGITGEDFPWVELDFEERPGFDDLAEALLKIWEKSIGVDMGLRIETVQEAAKTRVVGDFSVALGEVRGDVDDPAGWLMRFATEHPESGLGWEDEGFQALLAAAADIDAFLAGGEERLAALPEADRFRGAAKAAATSGEARERLRLALLGAAETRLLDASVVVPLLIPQHPHVFRGLRGLGSDKAWRNPAFHGSLRSARRGG